MDPISITGLIVDVSHIIARLIKYAKAVQGARSEMRKLSEELFALKGILDHLQAQSSSEVPKVQHVESEDSTPFNEVIMDKVLQTTREFLDSILKDLEPAESKLQSLKQKLEWPFTEAKVTAHLTRLERVKSWLILVLTADHGTVERDLQREIGSLARSLTEELKIREQERDQMANKELFQWMAPVSPAHSHLRASEGRNIASGKWFINGHLEHWLQYGDRNIFFLVGKCMLLSSTPIILY
jgi:chromosome segregation ATPase